MAEVRRPPARCLHDSKRTVGKYKDNSMIQCHLCQCIVAQAIGQIEPLVTEPVAQHSGPFRSAVFRSQHKAIDSAQYLCVLSVTVHAALFEGGVQTDPT